MATLAENFKDALGNIEPQRKVKGDDAKNAMLARDAVQDALEADPKLSDNWGIEPCLIGSYARQVSIRRIKDVDVFCRLTTPPASLTPGQALDEFERVLSKAFPDDCERQMRSFKIEFPEYDLSVDAVPARVHGEHWQVPSRPVEGQNAQWLETNPLYLGELTTKMNAQFTLGPLGDGVYVPVIKLVRQVRRSVLGQGSQPGGLFMELMAYWVFEERMTAQTTIAAYLTHTLEGIAADFPALLEDGLRDPTLEGETISTKAEPADLEAAAEKFEAAAKLARKALDTNDICASARLWQELLGENCDGTVFPLPSYCDPVAVAGAALTQSGHKPGATKLPSSDDRYALG